MNPVPAGTKVVTTTTSGAPIYCTVIKYYESRGEYLLRSQDHGYAIVRRRREFKIDKETQ